jgi:hypothetical protein
MRDNWGFHVIRGIGRRDLTLNPTGDSCICYVAETNHLIATRSSTGTTFLDAWIRRPIGAIDISARPDKTIAVMTLTDPRIQIEVTARTKSAPSVAFRHSFDKMLSDFSIQSEETFESNPFQLRLKLIGSRRIKKYTLFSKLSIGFFIPTIELFADHEFLQSRVKFNGKNPKIAFSFGDANSFFCCSVSRLKPVKIGGFANSERFAIGATATARKTLTLHGNLNVGGLSLSGLYYRTPLEQKFTIAGRKIFHSYEPAWKFETPDLITLSLGVGTPEIRIVFAGLLKIGGNKVPEMVRYGIEASFLGND